VFDTEVAGADRLTEFATDIVALIPGVLGERSDRCCDTGVK